MLTAYDHIDSLQLKQNHYNFLKEVIPVAESAGVRMAVHPDDLVLPGRVVVRVVADPRIRTPRRLGVDRLVHVPPVQDPSPAHDALRRNGAARPGVLRVPPGRPAAARHPAGGRRGHGGDG